MTKKINLIKKVEKLIAAFHQKIKKKEKMERKNFQRVHNNYEASANASF